jgi:hypothetical protein
MPIVAPTCFGSRRNHRQGAILCLAKTSYVMAAYQPVVRMCGTPLPWHWPRHKRRGYRSITVVLAKHKMAPWLWFLREPKHVGATIGILSVLIFLWFYNCVHHCGTIKSALILLMHGTNMKKILKLLWHGRVWNATQAYFVQICW